MREEKEPDKKEDQLPAPGPTAVGGLNNAPASPWDHGEDQPEPKKEGDK